MRAMKILGLSGALMILAWLASHVLLASRPGFQQACTVHVTPEQSVQSASSTAEPNAVVCLSEGTWQEDILIRRDDLTIKGMGADKTIITGALWIQGARRITVQGLTLRNGAFGVKLDGGAFLTLQENRIEASTGNGVDIMHVGLATLESNFIGNHETGIFISLGSVVQLGRNEITKNRRDGVEIAASMVDLRENKINENAVCGIRSDAGSTVTGRQNEILRNGERNLCGRFPDGFTTSAESLALSIAVLDETGTPAYLDGRVSNSADAALQVARERGLNARRITSEQIAAGELGSVTTLVLADNAPPEAIVDRIAAWWSQGRHLIVIDSSITVVLYGGLLFPELKGQPARSSQNTYWTYASSGTIVIQKEHPITSGFSVGQELSAVSTDALLVISRLPSQGTEVLAIDKVRRDQAAIVHYRGAGLLTFIGPDDNIRHLRAILGNAMALEVPRSVLDHSDH
jgi:hypothetical protein